MSRSDSTIGRREILKVTKITQKFDRLTGKFTINISYKTRSEITKRTIKAAEAFGLGIDEYRDFTIMITLN